jgi:hypothetical protein
MQTSSRRVLPDRSLLRCPEWPTSHTLPRPVVARLDRAMWQLRGAGLPARRQDVLGIAITFFAPTDPGQLLSLLTRPHHLLRGTVAGLPTGRHRGSLVENSEQIMVWLPSPVTLRLNALVDQLHDVDFAASRRQVVSAVVLHSLPTRAGPLAEAFDRYRTAPARAARVPGRPLREILTLDRPKPGRRPTT